MTNPLLDILTPAEIADLAEIGISLEELEQATRIDKANEIAFWQERSVEGDVYIYTEEGQTQLATEEQILEEVYKANEGIA